MNIPHGVEPQRDMSFSAFTGALRKLCERCPGVSLAVFFDSMGETIDYHTLSDPFTTRLVAAHYGVVFESCRARMTWLGMGDLQTIEMAYDDGSVGIIAVVGEECCLLIAAEGGSDPDVIHRCTQEAVEELREEAGF